MNVRYLHVFVVICFGIVLILIVSYCNKTFSEHCTNVDVTKQLPQRVYSESKRNKSKRTQCESCSEQIPDVIIQYGPPRTATTLQFQILCLMMALLHEDEINFVACYFNKSAAQTYRAIKYRVIKTHDLRNMADNLPSDFWIFMTSKSPTNNRRSLVIKNKSIRIQYIADIELVSKRSYFVAFEYQPIFDLSNDKMQVIIEYLRYWNILRLCCGLQMSADWRNQVSPKENYKQHHNPHSSAYPACEMYNISRVEHLFMRTYVFQKFAHIKSLHNVIGRPSEVDGELDGRYCERCNANIFRKDLKFNQKCV